MLMLPLEVLSAKQMVDAQQNWKKSSILHSSLKVAEGGFIIYRVMEVLSTTPQCVVM